MCIKDVNQKCKYKFIINIENSDLVYHKTLFWHRIENPNFDDKSTHVVSFTSPQTDFATRCDFGIENYLFTMSHNLLVTATRLEALDDKFKKFIDDYKKVKEVPEKVEDSKK